MGYRIFGDSEPSYLDCLYMTVITISTIGYQEVVAVDEAPGRIFNMILAFSGIGVMTYLISQITAYVVEGHLKINLINQKIERMVAKLEGHYIICGFGQVGETILADLKRQHLDFVLIDSDESCISELREQGHFVIQGDATDDKILEKAGAKYAAGLFAVTGEDNHNMVITLSARLLNPELKVVSRCEEVANRNKMSRAGADKVISPAKIGAIRMINEMVQPTMTTFVDQLFFNQNSERSVSSLQVGHFDGGIKITDIGLRDFPQTLILGVRKDNTDTLLYTPPRDTSLEKVTF